jgi:GNAT superfamily N-acetyltransferase
MSQYPDASSRLKIRLLCEQDVSGALELCRIAGWNQTQDDWRRLLEYEPMGCFVAERDGQLAATITTTRYGTQLAWVGMMLVHPEFRRRGIATALLQHGLAYLRARGVLCIKLDATPAGRPLYERLGFRGEWNFRRWHREGKDDRDLEVTCGGTRPVKCELHDDIQTLDIEAFGCDRTDFLRHLSTTSKTRMHPQGFGMLRRGHLASYLGPITARTAAVARDIVNGLLDDVSETVFWDLPQPNEHAVRLAQSLGFQPTRDLTRMWTGPQLVSANVQLQYAIADPGTG